MERLEERWLLDSQGLGQFDPLVAEEPLLVSAAQTAPTAVNVAWQFEGPAPLENVFGGGHFNLDPNFGSGAIEALAPHPTNSNIIYAGTVNGGIWRTSDAQQINPQWTPLTDFHQSLSISAIAFSPIDVNDDGTTKGTSTGTTVYAGTGNFSSGDAIGVLRSTDGTQFALMPGSEVFSNNKLKI